MDCHWKDNEKLFGIGKPVLVFQTRMGNMSGKLRFRWTGPYWITWEFKGSYQLGTLASEMLDKWVNGFRLKPYYRPMPQNLFHQPAANAEIGGGKNVTGNHEEEQPRDPVLPDNRN